MHLNMHSGTRNDARRILIKASLPVGFANDNAMKADRASRARRVRIYLNTLPVSNARYAPLSLNSYEPLIVKMITRSAQ